MPIMKQVRKGLSCYLYISIKKPRGKKDLYHNFPVSGLYSEMLNDI